MQVRSSNAYVHKMRSADDAIGEPQRYLSRRVRNVLLTAHVIVSVGLLGDSAGFLAVSIRAALKTRSIRSRSLNGFDRE